MVRKEAEALIEAALDQGIDCTDAINLLDEIDGNENLEGEILEDTSVENTKVVRVCPCCGYTHSCR